MTCLLARFRRDESGATAIEYGLLAAFLGVGIIASLTNVRNSYSTLYNNIYNGLNQ